MREMSVAEQRYKAVLTLIAGGRRMTEMARDQGVHRQTRHRWLARYEGDGLEGFSNRSHRPANCPHQPRLQWRRWCSRCVGHTLTGELAESPSSLPASRLKFGSSPWL